MVKNPPANAEHKGDANSIPGLERFLEEEMAIHAFSCPENSIDRRAWWVTVHAVSKNWIPLSTYTQPSLK